MIKRAIKLLRLGGYQKFRLYNVDVPDAQAYLYDKHIFPLACLGVTVQGDRLAYWLLDSVESVDYTVRPSSTGENTGGNSTDRPIPIEVSRTCRVPLHRVSRASIGTCV